MLTIPGDGGDAMPGDANENFVKLEGGDLELLIEVPAEGTSTLEDERGLLGKPGVDTLVDETSPPSAKPCAPPPSDSGPGTSMLGRIVTANGTIAGGVLAMFVGWLGALTLGACEAAVIRCADDRYCDGTAIESCRVDCDRNGNDCRKSYTRLECNAGPVPGTCDDSGGGPWCIDVGVRCSSPSPPSCHGDATVLCRDDGYQTTIPCPTNQTCHLANDGTGPFAHCVDEPPTSCNPAMYPVCVGATTIQRCVGSEPDGYRLQTTRCSTNECSAGPGSGGVGAFCS